LTLVAIGAYIFLMFDIWPLFNGWHSTTKIWPLQCIMAWRYDSIGVLTDREAHAQKAVW